MPRYCPHWDYEDPYPGCGCGPDDDIDYDEDDDRSEFADPGGKSALRAGNRVHPCPTCKAPNRLSAKDVALGYQCDTCADKAERGGGLMAPGKRYAVFAIKTQPNGSTVWVKAGVAFVNPDDSMNIILDVLPLDGKLHVREGGPSTIGTTGVVP